MQDKFEKHVFYSTDAGGGIGGQGEEEKEIKRAMEQIEIPEDFVEPEGESGKWKIIKGEFEIKGKKVEVSYREKVIELPKHRQEQTGVKRIRRRELLPPLPEGICDTSGEYFDPYSKEEKPQVPAFWNIGRKFENFYRFLTDNNYPSRGTLVHKMEWRNWFDSRSRESLRKHKREGLYFQEITPNDRYFYFSPTRAWGVKQGGGKFNTPIFVFGNRNKRLVEYIDFVIKNRTIEEWDSDFYYEVLEKLKKRDPILDDFANPDSEIKISGFGRRKGDLSNKMPLKWCHAELAIVPTKRSLNVLFFETGDEDKKEEEK